jgi:Fe-S cluster assembly ATPase SufC
MRKSKQQQKVVLTKLNMSFSSGDRKKKEVTTVLLRNNKFKI